MTGMDILKSLVRGTENEAAPALPPDELRFVLEYTEPPHLPAERKVIAREIESDAFVLEPLFASESPDLGRFVVLRFPGVERTLSREMLFQVSYALAEFRGLVSAEPDLGTALYADPEPFAEAPRVEGADVFSSLCRVATDPPDDRRWALGTMGVLRAWARFPSRGEGVLIAQPDTGVAVHDELDPSALRLDLSTDILGRDDDPTDPLRPGMANPGHGTSTASVVVSGPTGSIVGSAPGASLVPIRCIEDVKVFNAAPVARAIEYAVRARCDVITMSLGGVPSRGVHAACRAAIEAGTIILAAAGNCVRLVVYPARYSEVIAVAAVNVNDAPWRGTSRGGSVDIAAPGEQVWRAQRSEASAPTSVVGPGQGTSYAVALTAGAAALWLAHHGRAAIRAEAARRGQTVQTLFRAALRQTARRPHGWDASRFGAGIVDAEALLALELGQIRTSAVESAHTADSEIASLLTETMGPGPHDPAFDWTRFGLEVATVLYEDASAGRPPGDELVAESSAARVHTSRALADRAQASDDPRLRRIGRRVGERGARAPGARAPEREGPRSTLGILARPAGTGLESAATMSLEAARERLRSGGMREVLDRAERILGRLESQEADANAAAGRQLLGDAERGMEELVQQRRLPVGGRARVALEALVQLVGRPAIRVEGGTIDPDHPQLDEWQAPYVIARPEIDSTFASIGRIDRDGVHVGTGIVVAEGLVMTNRHVIEEFAAPVPTRTAPKRWIMESGVVTIDFSDAADGSKAFAIKGIVEAGADPILRDVNFANLDVALLEVETSNAAGMELPGALCVIQNAAVIERPNQLYVVGYPARPTVLPFDAEGRVRMDVAERLREVFGMKYGRKYFSPGVVSGPLGTLADDTKSWVFNHDATTLGGSSGSAAIYLGDPVAIVGLHFAGDWLRANHAHSLSAVRAAGGLPNLSRLCWV